MESNTSFVYDVSTTVSPAISTPTAFTSISALTKFSDEYRPIHGVLAPTICVLGVVANCLNTVVLTRKNMLSSTNVLLTWLAIADGLTMMVYLPFAILNYHVFILPKSSPYVNAVYMMFFAVFIVVIHSISIWLTVSLAIFRYVVIHFPIQGAELCSVYRARVTVCIVSLLVTLVCVPNFVSCTVRSTEHNNQTLWYVAVRADTAGYQLLKNFNLWIQAFLLKLIPCFLLTVINLLLIKQMKGVGKRRMKQLNKSGSNSENVTLRNRRTNRTTRMLVVVVVILVLTETPHGILMLVGGIVEGFFDNVYVPLGDLIDTLALFNSGINFILYCTMSKQFQATFIRIFLCNDGRYDIRSMTLSARRRSSKF